ncbi:SOS response-associated peptidase family protein [Variovorax dokdonensis]|uniref:Abasic site processing protein n=1 Tax=Variovorax dokdonensis TaxID=344883 RepID=A0ABT7N5E1_9BURK|nr:SOS response-associated peptidase family protein [Variovorax dokdonensis]MDM0043156.1 SOS response-associated peptidase family protein [Variovorax dokdonensis]
MIHHYQSTGDPAAYLQNFGVSFQPTLASSVVRPGERGIFIRRPRADHPGSTRPIAAFEAVSGRWGLIPLFSQTGSDPLFEARAEAAAAERNFHQPWKRGHRCVVLADAVVQDHGAPDHLLRVSRADGRPLAMASLWNGWRSPQDECVESFALLTVAPAGSDVRQPALLHDAWLEDWLSCPVEETSAYLRPCAQVGGLVSQEIPRG